MLKGVVTVILYFYSDIITHVILCGEYSYQFIVPRKYCHYRFIFSRKYCHYHLYFCRNRYKSRYSIWGI